MHPLIETRKLLIAPSVLQPRRSRPGNGRPGVASRTHRCSAVTSRRRPPRTNDEGPAGSPISPLPGEGQAGHLPVPVRRPVADGPVRLQAAAGRPARHRAARLDPQGPAADRHDLAAGRAFPSRPSQVHVRPARPERRLGQRTAAAHRQRRRRAVLHQVDAHRGDQPRPGHHLLPDRRASWPGRPSIGAWLSYGLGSENQRPAGLRRHDLAGQRQPDDQPLYDRLWGSGFLPTQYQGVKFRSGGDPVLYLSNPAGLDDATRRRMLDDLAQLNQLQARRRPATRRSPRASPSTRWPTACRRRCRS